MRIEWDDNKNVINKRKHGISLEAAAYVFDDEYRIEIIDDRHSAEELQYITIGKVRSVLFVVYTQRGETSRLISARMATPAERRMYYGQFDYS